MLDSIEFVNVLYVEWKVNKEIESERERKKEMVLHEYCHCLYRVFYTYTEINALEIETEQVSMNISNPFREANYSEICYFPFFLSFLLLSSGLFLLRGRSNVVLPSCKRKTMKLFNKPMSNHTVYMN